MPMALRDKLNSLAAEAASKANTAIENGKLSLKINNEEKKIDEFTLNIGELVLDKLDGGETFDDEIMALYSSIQAAREVIARARADIEASRQGEEAEEDALSPTCSSCGAASSKSGEAIRRHTVQARSSSPEARFLPRCCNIGSLPSWR